MPLVWVLNPGILIHLPYSLSAPLDGPQKGLKVHFRAHTSNLRMGVPLKVKGKALGFEVFGVVGTKPLKP